MYRIAVRQQTLAGLVGRVSSLLAMLFVIAIAGSSVATVSAQARPSHRGGRVLAETYMTPQSGGHLASRVGVAITVPAGVMTRPGNVTITSLGRGVYNVHIHAPWHGSVQVTLPLGGKRNRVLHDVGGVWLNESQTPGQSTVTVTQLSSFTTFLSNVAGKISGDLCLSFSLTEIEDCIVEKVGDHIDGELVSWIESKLPQNCVLQLAEAGITSAGGGPAAIVLSIMKQAVSGSCVGQAGETGPIPPVPSASSPPSTPTSPSTPATPSPSTPAGEASPPPAEEQSPPPPPSPPPAGKSIEIGWNSGDAGSIWMRWNGFATGSHEFRCVFNNETDPYTLGETESPETWTEHTCWDEESGGTVRVESEGVSSNTLTVS